MKFCKYFHKNGQIVWSKERLFRSMPKPDEAMIESVLCAQEMKMIIINNCCCEEIKTDKMHCFFCLNFIKKFIFCVEKM